MPSQSVLIIDDDHAIAKGVSMRLKHAGYRISTAFDGEDGLEKVDAERPDVVVLDVRMPGKDGLTVLRELRLNAEHVHRPVIMLSASLQDQQTALDAGAQCFLTKPYQSCDLLNAMASVLNVTTSNTP